MTHLCHALGCETPVNPCFLMCGYHWFKVSVRCKQAVYATYVPGQELTKMTTAAYRQAAAAAIIAVAEQEGVTIPAIYRIMAAGEEK
mgnify:FL=1